MGHPVAVALQEIDAALTSIVDTNPAFMSPLELSDAMVEATRLEAQLAEVRLRMLACADEVAARVGARTAGDWLARETRHRSSDMRADHRLGVALDRDRSAVAAGLRGGALNLPQARAIVRALEDLPSDTPTELVADAEAELVRLADRFDPTELARLGRRILEVIAPDVADAYEARRLAELEKSARERQRLRLRSCGDGTTRISGLIPDAVAARLSTYLDAFANPRRDHTGTGVGQPDPTDPTKRMPYPRRAAEAFARFLEAADPSRMPIHGGDATTIVVTIDLEALMSELGTATLGATAPGDSLDRISAAQARRLACSAHIVPAVLGGDSEVLDLGRAQRLFTKAQRRALLLEHPTCQAEGCDIPGTWSEAHHWVPWSHGGPTDLANATLLCSVHHHRAHDADYRVALLPSGDVRFNRRR